MKNNFTQLFRIGIFAFILAILTFAALTTGIFVPTLTFFLATLAISTVITTTFILVTALFYTLCTDTYCNCGNIAVVSGFLAIITSILLLLNVANEIIFFLGTVLLIIFVTFLLGGIWCYLNSVHRCRNC